MKDNISFFEKYFAKTECQNFSTDKLSVRLDNIMKNVEKPGEAEYLALNRLTGCPVELYSLHSGIIQRNEIHSAELYKSNIPIRLAVTTIELVIMYHTVV